MTFNFDLEKYLRVSKRLDVDDLDWDRMEQYDLGEDEIRVLRYFIDIETYTIIYLKELLSTPAAYDPEITAFLCCWNYEEYFHGHQLERFLKAYGTPVTQFNRRTMETENWWNKAFVAAQAVFSKLLDWRCICVHMTWGALNELTTLTAYNQLAAKTKNPILREICERIIKDERRHFSFYFNQAKLRLEDPLSRRLTRLLVDRFWTIVGSGVKPAEDVDFVVRMLFGGPEGRKVASAMDLIMHALPGFEGFNACELMQCRYNSCVQPAPG